LRVVIQRVERASVQVEGEVIGAIQGGLLILVGVGQQDLALPDAPRGRGEPQAPPATHAPDAPPAPREGDAAAKLAALADKVAHLRIFADDSGRSNLSILDTGGSALVISQFTLYADTRRGRRPSFTEAADPGPAEALVEQFRLALEGLGVPTASGRFGAHMTVSLVNDGPYTIVLDTEG
jgi:D-tyrosyl-tRNA(Tyr) deacylase